MLKAYPAPNFSKGPQIGLAISHKEVYEGIFNTSQQYNPNNFDYGVNFELVLKNVGISLGVRYHDLVTCMMNNKAFNRVWHFSWDLICKSQVPLIKDPFNQKNY
jgi:hypothetical protein